MLVLAALVVLAAALSWAGHQWLQQRMQEPLALAGPTVFELAPGGGLALVNRRLAADGVLPDAFSLRLHARLSGRGERIHAGEYLLQPGMTPLQLLDHLERGLVRQYSLTLVEGWTISQVLTALRAATALQQTLPEDVAVEDLLPLIGADQSLATHPEGLLFPDTYNYIRGTSDRELLLRALRRMQQVLQEEWEQRAPDLPLDTPYDALILASIIERETGVPGERGEIAGVFARRLQRGMRLQTDPTIIYGLGDAFDGRLRRVHLRDASNPYNTYRHGGLPPTPIGLPGRAAIRAALNPEPGETLFFVARGDGSHHFSVTLAEHEAAVRKYQIEQRRADYRSSPPPPAARGNADNPRS